MARTIATTTTALLLVVIALAATTGSADAQSGCRECRTCNDAWCFANCQTNCQPQFNVNDCTAAGQKAGYSAADRACADTQNACSPQPMAGSGFGGDLKVDWRQCGRAMSGMCEQVARNKRCNYDWRRHGKCTSSQFQSFYNERVEELCKPPSGGPPPGGLRPANCNADALGCSSGRTCNNCRCCQGFLGGCWLPGTSIADFSSNKRC